MFLSHFDDGFSFIVILHENIFSTTINSKLLYLLIKWTCIQCGSMQQFNRYNIICIMSYLTSKILKINFLTIFQLNEMSKWQPVFCYILNIIILLFYFIHFFLYILITTLEGFFELRIIVCIFIFFMHI